jgi:outer membrane lipoprotein-sorting protein
MMVTFVDWISPLRNLLGRVLSLLALCLWVNQSALAAEVSMKELMQLLAQSKHIKAQFTEVKHVKVLDGTIESSGELVFQAPAKLEKRTIAPRLEVLRIDGATVAIEKGQFKRTMSLTEYPDVASLVQSLTATFRGDQNALEQFFSWTLTGPIEKWTLTLKPKSQKLYVTLREIKLIGSGSHVKTVETTLTDGDYSVMSLAKPVTLP